MSSSTNTEPISGIWWISQATHCVVASACILAYDILITGDREVACIWNRKFSGVTVIFVNIRYVTLISQIAWVAFLTQPGVYLPCKITYFILFSASIWVSVVSAVFNTLRIWAIWGRHWGILAVGLPINLLPAALNLVRAVPSIGYVLALTKSVSWFYLSAVRSRLEFCARRLV